MILAPADFVGCDCHLGSRHGRMNQRLFRAPAVAHSIFENATRQIKAIFPLDEGERLSPERQPHIVASIAMLLDRGRPAAVSRLVIAVIVNPVNRVLGRRARPHIREEVLEGSPAIAHGDTSPAVVPVSGDVGIRASRPHAGPDSIHFGRLAANAMTVFRSLLPDLISGALGAPARDAPSVAKVIDCSESFGAAIALTAPDDLAAATLGGRFNGNEPAESLPGKVNSHDVIYSTPGCP